MLPVVLAAIDVAVGAYLIRYAVRRERGDKDAVLAVGIFLVICAGLLLLIEVLLEPGQLMRRRGRPGARCGRPHADGP